jgi:alpha-tubulin suppressor-like RCC1 family protein
VLSSIWKRYSNTVLSAGNNDNNELCRPGKRSLFQRIELLETFKVIDATLGDGFFHSLTQQGQLLSWGINEYGQLGNGNREKKEKPRINTHIKEPLIQIVSGQQHSVAITKSGKVITWGGNRKGQLGDGQLTSSTNPIYPLQLKHRPVVSIACGESHSIVITSGGNAFSWGANDQGQLGHGDLITRLRPEWIRNFRSNKAIKVACGRSHTMIIASNGLLFACGSNSHGQCGFELSF